MHTHKNKGMRQNKATYAIKTMIKIKKHNHSGHRMMRKEYIHHTEHN